MYNVVNKTIINSYLKDNKMCKTKFSKLCKISVNTFNKIMTNKNFNIICIFRIAKTMGVPVCKLFV